MKYSFDDMNIGTTETGNSLSVRLFPRPPGFSNNTEWYDYAKGICKLLNDQHESALKLDSANITLYSGLWRYGLPEVPRDRMTLQAFINAVGDHFRRKALPPRPGEKLRPAFSAHQLHAELDAKRMQHDMTWKDIALQTGVPTTTLSKMKDNKNCPNIESCLALCKWLGADPNRYLFMVAK